MRIKIGPRALGAAVACAAIVAVAPALAQDEDPDMKKLREDADRQIEADKKKKPETPLGDDDATALRAAADSKGNEDRGLLGRAYASATENLNAFNPRMVISGDLLGRLAANHYKTVQDGKSIDDRISLREAEMDLRADIDPYAKGVVIFAVAETDPGTFAVDIEEGYFTLEQLPYQFKLKAGRFRVPFGRMNALHTHDLPQSTRPYALADLFGPEGYNDNGADLSWLAPGPLPIELHAIILNGENPRTLAQGRSNQPAYMTRAETFFQINDVSWLSLGASYLFGYNDTRGTIEHPHQPFQETQLAEVDALFKYQPNQRNSLVILAEAYNAIKHDRIDVNTGQKNHDNGLGAFGFVQIQPAEQWYLGVRGDWSTFDEARPGHGQWATSAWLAYYTTEFLRFRVGFEHRERSRRSGDPDHNVSPNDTVFFEVTFVFGAHPAEPFWVNK